ncbi:MAG: phage terminase large subunit, partial [Candidatus Cybelea sp.]
DVARTRLMQNGRIVLCQTRWHDDDLSGRILNSEDGKRWTVLSLPAIAEENDPLGRKPGEALWPAVFPADKLPSVERGEMSSTSFASLYQQNPVPAGGAMFKGEWLENFYDTVPRIREEIRAPISGSLGYTDEVIEQPPFIIQAIDSAWKDGPSNDRSCIATLASDRVDIFVVDVVFGRWQFTALYKLVKSLFRKHNPGRLFVEEAASGFAIVNQLRAETSVPVIGVPPGRESKAARAESVTAFFEAGRIRFPKSAPWLEELRLEFLRFPHGKHDDIVDAVVLGVRQMIGELNRILEYEHFERQRFNLRDWIAK